MSLQSVEIQRRLAPQLPRVKGNENQLQQVFMNIILNAYHAMPHGGELIIASGIPVTPAPALGSLPAPALPDSAPPPAADPHAARDDRPGVEVRFSDTGCGIPQENLSRIFDPFFTTMPVGVGTGLGLSIAYSIVRQHGGTIGVESEVGKGSIFTVQLPAAPAGDAAPGGE
jgi:signal transduction histidine kinase